MSEFFVYFDLNQKLHPTRKNKEKGNCEKKNVRFRIQD